MPRQEDDKLRRIAIGLDRVFFSRYINSLKSMPLMTRLLLGRPQPAIWAIAREDEHGLESDLLETVPLLLFEYPVTR